MTWSEMVEAIEQSGGEYRQGINYDTITIRGKGHQETAERIFREARESGIKTVYDLFHYEGYSSFLYR